MKKNLEGLAEIGEKYILGQLNEVISYLKSAWEKINKEGSSEFYIEYHKNIFREELIKYRKVEELAINQGLSISNYQRDFSRLYKQYRESTGEKEVTTLKDAFQMRWRNLHLQNAAK